MPPVDILTPSIAQERGRSRVTENARKPPAWVRFHPERYLQGTASLPLALEAVYWRVCALICASGDALADRDKDLGRLTKAHGGWPRMKADLIARGKIEVVDGFIRQGRCSEEVERSQAERMAKTAGGLARAEQIRRGDTPPTLLSGGQQQVIENAENQPSGCTQIKKEDKEKIPSPPGKASSPPEIDEVDTSAWDALDLPAPAPSLTVVPLPTLTPAQQVTQAKRLMDKALVDAMKAVGIPERNAWGLAAKWKKAIGQDAVMTLISQVERDPPAGPVVPWMTRMVQREVDRKNTAGRSSGMQRGYGDF